MIPNENKNSNSNKDWETKKKKETQHLVGCGLRTVFCLKVFLPNGTMMAQQAGWNTKKNNQSRARTTTAAKRQTLPHGSSSALACLDRRCSLKRRNATACATFVTKSKGENTWEKTEYKPFFDSGNHIFSKNERFFTILIKIWK